MMCKVSRPPHAVNFQLSQLRLQIFSNRITLNDRVSYFDQIRCACHSRGDEDELVV